MNQIWSLDIDDVIAIQKWASSEGVKPGESYEKYLIAYTKAKGIKPIGATELNREELITEYLSHGKEILDMEVNNDGKTKYTIIKPKDE